MHKVCFQRRIRRECIEEYRKRHAAVRPDMLSALREAAWNNYTLFLGEDGLLVGYFETEDLPSALSALESTDANRQWMAEMADYFEDGMPNKAFLQQIFALEDQLAILDLETGAGES